MKIVHNTHYRYAKEKIQSLEAANLLTTHCRFSKWTPVTEAEMYAFLAVILNMGIISLPNLPSNWSISWSNSISFFGSVFSRARFEAIFWMFHISHVPDNATPCRIDKVKILQIQLITLFKSNMQPSTELSVDETMVGFRGRFGPKQYISNKPSKYGIKAFTLADSNTGFILDILVYTGADTLINSNPAFSSLPQPGRVVMKLLGDYLNEGQSVYTDRYYTSIPLAKALEDHSTSFTGTCQKNRKMLPAQFRSSTFRLSDCEVIS